MERRARIPENAFGRKVRKARIDRGWTVEQMMDKASMSRPYLNMIERGGVAPPSPKVIRRIARALRMSERHLLALAHAQKAPRQVRDLFAAAVLRRFQRVS